MSGVAGLLYSQLGYDLGLPMRAIVRGPRADLLSAGAVFEVLEDGRPVFTGAVSPWGEKWGAHWWIADFSALAREGTFTLVVREGDAEAFRGGPFQIGRSRLWEASWRLVALDQSRRRARLAMNRVGWQDCGAAWQEANSHAALLIGFCDLLEFALERIAGEDLAALEAQIVNGCDYLARLQDRAAELGAAPGAVSHQIPKFEEIMLPADASKAALAWARASRLLSGAHADRKADYRDRAVRAFLWAEAAPPCREGFARGNHGAPPDYVIPEDWMTRDLLMMCWAAFALHRCGDGRFAGKAVALAGRVLRRQISRADAEGGLYGHFRTFEGSPFSEKAWVHHIDQGKLGMDAGGHFPHYLIPLLRMREAWPDHPDAAEWTRALRDFAYSYFLPACRANPFLLLPLGYFEGHGLLWFSGLWHGMNGAYALAAVLAREFEALFGDPAFGEIAAGNLQWIAGLNAGLTAESLHASHMFSMAVEPGVAAPVSMILGLGGTSAGSWLNVRGSICNGFSTGDQFVFDVEPGEATDAPDAFTDEDWITHSGAWLGALARLACRA